MVKKTNEKLIPIDIHYDKLVDWMIDRNKTDIKWAKELPELRDRISHNLSDLPLNIRNKYDIGHTIHYWMCYEIFQTLENEEIEKNGKNNIKNMFGNYQNNILQNWSQLIKDYKKKNICLAEAGRLLAQAVNFDIPNLKHTISSNDKQLSDIGRKLGDCESSVKKFQREYDESCSKMNLKGIDIRNEILQSVCMLDGLLVKVERSACASTINEAIIYYRSFANYALRKSFNNDNNNESNEEVHIKLLETLENIVTERQKLDSASDSSDDFVKVNKDSLINNDDDNKNETENGDNNINEISWDITIDSTGAVANFDIDDIDDIDTNDTNDMVVLDNDEIDWGIELEDNDNNTVNNTNSLVTKTTTTEDFQFPVTSLLDDSNVRNGFLVDLLELEAFLSERIHEVSSDNSKSLNILTDSTAPKCLQLTGVESLISMKDCVQKVVDELKDPKLQQLLLIRSSSLYVDRLVDTLQKKLSSVDRLKRTIDTLHERQSNLQQSLQRCTHKLSTTILYVKTLQKHAEQYLSIQYDHREVNIFGDINTI